MEKITIILNEGPSSMRTWNSLRVAQGSAHKSIANALSCETYFAKPYHLWERGQNENANGLLRQYFPKSMELVDVAFKVVMKAVHKLNSRPRK